ncbi:MAG: DVU_1551 family NTP transferase [Desulforhopalus sp.]
MAPHLSAIILAAGFSSRMGKLKATLPLGTETVLDLCIGLFKTCGIEEFVVVTGHRPKETGAIAERAGARVVFNPDFAEGMYSSIKTGVGQLAKESDGFFLLPVDIPLVRLGTIRLLGRSFSVTPAAVTYPTFVGRRGHPPLIGHNLYPAILDKKNSDGGLRSLLHTFENKNPEQIVDVPVADANIRFDMDTPEEYTAGLRRAGRMDYPTPEEAAIILQLYPMPAKGLAHGRLVGSIAKALCRAISHNTGRILDPELCQVCGWLHDMAKGHANHEQEAGRWLHELGFDRAAEIVAAHKDLEWQPGSAITEKELVHIADKLARGSRIVDLAARFKEKLDLYSDKPEVVQAIHRRFELARRIGAAVEAESGQLLEDILAHIQNG